MIGRARAVANAAGGFLDATPSVSAEEHAALDALDRRSARPNARASRRPHEGASRGRAG